MQTLGRGYRGLDLEDPITTNMTTKKTAYYIQQDVSKDGSIKTVYRKSTLLRLLDSDGVGKSPMSRKPFREHDIKPYPLEGKVHPDLMHRPIETILRNADTKKSTWSTLTVGQTMTWSSDDNPGKLFDVTRLDNAADGSRQYRVESRVDIIVKGRSAMDSVAEGLAAIYEQNRRRVRVTESRVVRK